MTAVITHEQFGDDVTAMAPAIANSPQVRTAFSGFPAAVGALCAVVDDQPCGMVATSLMVGISYNPPMVLFSVRNDSSTWPILRRAERIGISVLAEHQGSACRQISSKQSADRFTDLEITVTEQGALFVCGAITWMDCEISSEFPAGDHRVIIFLVHEVGHSSTQPPLLFHNGRFPRMRQHGSA